MLSASTTLMPNYLNLKVRVLFFDLCDLIFVISEELFGYIAIKLLYFTDSDLFF